MNADRLADAALVGASDPGRLKLLADRLPTGDGWTKVTTPPGWRAVVKGVGDDVFNANLPLVLEGWPSVLLWGDGFRAGHERLRDAALKGRWASVPGDVSYVHLDEGGTGALVRAPAARVPIYVDTRDGICIATRMDLLLALRPEWPWEIDPFAAAVWTTSSGVLPPERVPIQGVRRLGAGHVARVDASREVVETSSRYWDPRPNQPGSYDAREHATQLREAILSTLASALDAEGRNVLKLSLGTDSSCLAVLTRRNLGLEYEAISYLPVNAVDRAQEERYRLLLTEIAPPTRHTQRHLDGHQWTDVIAGDADGGLPVVDPSLIELPHFHGGVRTFFGGEWADAACGDRITLADWMVEAPFPSLVRHMNRLDVGEKATLEVIWRRLTRRLPLDSQTPVPLLSDRLVAPAVVAEAADWADELTRRSQAEDPRHLRLFHELDSDVWLLQNWEVLSGLGIRRVTPFYTRTVIELAFAAPATGLIGRHTKKPLRAGLARDVPHALLWRPKGLWPNEPWGEPRRWERDLPEELEPLLRADWFPRPTQPLDFAERFALSALESYTRRLQALSARAR